MTDTKKKLTTPIEYIMKFIYFKYPAIELIC